MGVIHGWTRVAPVRHVCVLRERMAGRGLYIDKLLMGNICNGCCKANFIAAVSLVMIGVRSD